MSQDEVLRLAAEVTDRFSAPLKNMQRQMRLLSDQVKGTHREGKVHADEHSLALQGLSKSIKETSEKVRSGLDPAFAGLGLRAFTVAGGITAVVASVKNFATSARDLTFLSRQTGLAVNTLRLFQDIAPKIGTSADAMSAGLSEFNTHMERLARNPLLERKGTFDHLANIGGRVNPDVYNLFEKLKTIKDRKDQLQEVLSFIGKIRDQSQKVEFTQSFFGGLAALTNMTVPELNKALKESHDRIGDLTEAQIEAGKKAAESWDNLLSTFGRLNELVGEGLTKSFTKLTKSVDEWLQKNRDGMVKEIEHDVESIKHNYDEIDELVRRLTAGEGVDWSKILNVSGLDKTWEVFTADWNARLAKLLSSVHLVSKGVVDKTAAEYQRVLKQDFPEQFEHQTGLTYEVKQRPHRMLFKPTRASDRIKQDFDQLPEVKPENPYKPFQLPNFRKGEQPKKASQPEAPEAKGWLSNLDKSMLAVKIAEWAGWGAAKVPAIAAKVPFLETLGAWGPASAASAAMWAGGKLHEETHSHEPMTGGEITKAQRNGLSVHELLRQEYKGRYGSPAPFSGAMQSDLTGASSRGIAESTRGIDLPGAGALGDKRDQEATIASGTRKGVFDGLWDYYRSSLSGGAGAGAGSTGGTGGGITRSLTTGGPGGTGGASAGPQASEPGHAGETPAGTDWKGMASKVLPKSFVGAGENAVSGARGALDKLRQYGRQRSSAMGGAAEAGAAGGGEGEQGNIDRYMKGLSFLETDNDARKAAQSEGGNTGYFRQNANDAAWAKAHGLPDPRFGSYQEQAKNNFDYMKKYPGAQEAIKRGDYATANRILNKNWVSLPGGSQPQSAAKMREYQKMLAAGGPNGTAGAGVMPGATTAVGGKPPDAFIFHHTGGRGSIEGVKNTLRQRGLGVEYIMDREGNIVPFSGPGAAHMMRGWGKGAGLSNRNTVGMEVIAKNDRDVTEQQVKAAQEFRRRLYPNTPVFGHGEVNPGHKEADEGMAIVRRIRGERASAMRTTMRSRMGATGHPRKLFGQSQVSENTASKFSEGGFGQVDPADVSNWEKNFREGDQYKKLPLSNNVDDRRGEKWGAVPRERIRAWAAEKLNYPNLTMHGRLSKDLGLKDLEKLTKGMRLKYAPSPRDFMGGGLLQKARAAGMLPEQTHKVAGNASVEISLSGFPKGTNTKTSSSGVFKEVKLNRGRTMPLASQEA